MSVFFNRQAFLRCGGSHPEQDTGNKVIMQFVDKVLAKSLHAIVDVMSLLIWRHLEVCFTQAGKEPTGLSKATWWRSKGCKVHLPRSWQALSQAPLTHLRRSTLRSW